MIFLQLQADKPNLVAAINAFKQAQTVYTKEDLPANWAMVESNLGELYCHLAKLSNGDQTGFKSAIAHAGQALEVFMEKKITAYQRYAEHQLTSYKACRADHPDRCICR